MKPNVRLKEEPVWTSSVLADKKSMTFHIQPGKLRQFYIRRDDEPEYVSFITSTKNKFMWIGRHRADPRALTWWVNGVAVRFLDNETLQLTNKNNVLVHINKSVHSPQKIVPFVPQTPIVKEKPKRFGTRRNKKGAKEDILTPQVPNAPTPAPMTLSEARAIARDFFDRKKDAPGLFLLKRAYSWRDPAVEEHMREQLVAILIKNNLKEGSTPEQRIEQLKAYGAKALSNAISLTFRNGSQNTQSFAMITDLQQAVAAMNQIDNPRWSEPGLNSTRILNLAYKATHGQLKHNKKALKLPDQLSSEFLEDEYRNSFYNKAGYRSGYVNIEETRGDERVTHSLTELGFLEFFAKAVESEGDLSYLLKLLEEFKAQVIPAAQPQLTPVQNPQIMLPVVNGFTKLSKDLIAADGIKIPMRIANLKLTLGGQWTINLDPGVMLGMSGPFIFVLEQKPMEIHHTLKVYYLRRGEPLIIDEVTSDELNNATTNGLFSGNNIKVELKDEGFVKKTSDYKLNDTQTISFKVLEGVLKGKYVEETVKGDYKDLALKLIKMSKPGDKKARFIINFYKGKYLSSVTLERGINENPYYVLILFQARLNKFSLDPDNVYETSPQVFPRIIQYIADAESKPGARLLLGKKKILLVGEDNESMQLSKKVLKYAGADSIANASFGNDCLRMLRIHMDDQFDLVLTDVTLPEAILTEGGRQIGGGQIGGGQIGDGQTLNRNINKMYPGTKVMIWSDAVELPEGYEYLREAEFSTYSKNLPFSRLIEIISKHAEPEPSKAMTVGLPEVNEMLKAKTFGELPSRNWDLTVPGGILRVTIEVLDQGHFHIVVEKNHRPMVFYKKLFLAVISDDTGKEVIRAGLAEIVHYGNRGWMNAKFEKLDLRAIDPKSKEFHFAFLNEKGEVIFRPGADNPGQKPGKSSHAMLAPLINGFTKISEDLVAADGDEIHMRIANLQLALEAGQWFDQFECRGCCGRGRAIYFCAGTKANGNTSCLEGILFEKERACDR